MYFFSTSDSTLESAGPITLTARETEQEPLLFMSRGMLATLKTASFILCALISIPHSARVVWLRVCISHRKKFEGPLNRPVKYAFTVREKY